MSTQNYQEERIVDCGDAHIHYHLERKNVRNLNLRIHRDGSVFISAHPDISLNEIEEFVYRKKAYILSAQEEFENLRQFRPQPKHYVSGETFNILGHGLRLDVSQGSKNKIVSDGVYLRLTVRESDDENARKRVVELYLRRQCRKVFGEALNELYPIFQKYDVPLPKLYIRDMETRWGSCSPKGKVITLNKQLLEVPKICIDYVIMHELCHLIHPNHSAHFYEFLTMLMPDWKDRRDRLNKYAVYQL